MLKFSDSGIPTQYPGPFHCYLDNHTCEDVAAVQDFLEEILDQEGPFDGVVGFSQGAEVIISYLLDLKRRDPLRSPPFRFAVFFSPVVAFSSDPDYCREEIWDITEFEFDHLKQTIKNTLSGEPPYQTRTVSTRAIEGQNPGSRCPEASGTAAKEVLMTSLEHVLRAGARSEVLNVAHLQRCVSTQDRSMIPRPFNASLLTERITIPVVYTNGSQEHPDLLDQSNALRDLFHKSRVQYLVHTGGHEPPRAISEIKEVIQAITWADEESRRRFM